jgi:uncharacterized membrane protein
MSMQAAIATPVTTVRQRAVARLTRSNRWHLAGVGALTALIAAFYSVYALVLYATYQDSSYDLVIFDQAIRSYSRFHLGISVIKGVHNGFSPNFSVLGDHFSPLDAVLAPLYWIHDGPQTLLIAQPILFALAIPWLWVFTRRALGGAGWKATTGAYLVCVSYGLSWPIATAVAFDYHEAAFAPLLIAIAFERLQAGRLRSALISLGLLLLVKEDMGLLVAGLGVALLVSLSPTIPRQRLVGILLIVVGVAYSVLAVDVLIPAFGGRANYYWAYSRDGNSIPQVIVHILAHPREFLRRMFFPAIKLNTLEWLFAPLLFLPLLSPLTLAALPLLIERMQADPRFNSWWGMRGQYNAYLIIILVFAAVDGAARLGRWIARFWQYMESGRSTPAIPAAAMAPGSDGQAATGPTSAAGAAGAATEPASTDTADQAPPASASAAGLADLSPEETQRRVWSGFVALACCTLICAATLLTLPRFAAGEALHPSFYAQTARSRAAAAADNAVPSGVVVAAANGVGPELSARDTVLMWDGDGYTPPFAAPWVVADVTWPEMTFRGIAHQRAAVAQLLQHGYTIVFQRDGYVVLHRPGPPHVYVSRLRMDYAPAAS